MNKRMFIFCKISCNLFIYIYNFLINMIEKKNIEFIFVYIKYEKKFIYLYVD